MKRGRHGLSKFLSEDLEEQIRSNGAVYLITRRWHLCQHNAYRSF